MRILSTVVCFSALVANSMLAQDSEERKPLELPDCDIFLFEMEESDGVWTVSGGTNITDRTGYDNQPWFAPNSQSILFSANRNPHRTDIYEYFIESGETQQVTDSPDQEYSPQISPDNKTLSFVTDGETANQSIWHVERGKQDPQWLLKNQGDREPVGYYSWNHQTGYILFWSRYGFSMRLVHQTRDLSHYVTGNAIPTTPHVIPGTNRFSFMHQQGNGEVWIKELDPETLAIRPLTSVIGSNRNYGWTPGGNLLMCDGTRLQSWTPESKGQWKLVADLDSFGIKNVTRIAISPDGKKLAVVGLPKDD